MLAGSSDSGVGLRSPSSRRAARQNRPWPLHVGTTPELVQQERVLIPNRIAVGILHSILLRFFHLVPNRFPGFGDNHLHHHLELVQSDIDISRGSFYLWLGNDTARLGEFLSVFHSILLMRLT